LTFDFLYASNWDLAGGQWTILVVVTLNGESDPDQIWYRD